MDGLYSQRTDTLLFGAEYPFGAVYEGAIMIQVAPTASDLAMAWRVRDLLAQHPLLGGSGTRLTISACRASVVVEGWAADEDLVQHIRRTAHRAAGARPVLFRVQTATPDPTPVASHPYAGWGRPFL